MLALAQKQDINAMVRELFDFLYKEDLIEDAFANIEKGRTGHGASLIKIMASIYDAKLFNHSVMGNLMDCINDIPIKHFSANATDFENGLPFRFQVTEGRIIDDTKSTYGVFGNSNHRFRRDIAQYVTLGEALACSSCFPSGFEPMMFPDDFKVCQNEIAAKKDSFGIMDGGVVDNQGIEPILLAEERMRKCDKGRKDKALELVIVSDVSSSNMNGYSPCQQRLPKSIGGWTIAKLQQYALFAEFVISLLLIVAFFANNHYIIGAIAVIWGMVTVANVALRLINNKIVGLLSNTIIGKNASFIVAIWHNGLNLASSQLQARTNTYITYPTHTGTGEPNYSWTYSHFHPVDVNDWLGGYGTDEIVTNTKFFGNDFNTFDTSVQTRLGDWGKWLINTVGFDGFRLDFVRGFQEQFVADWIDGLPLVNGVQPFIVGEYWGADFRIKNWVNTIASLGADVDGFDFPLKNTLTDMCNSSGSDFDMSWLNHAGLVRNNAGNSLPGTSVVTFLDNHDTGKEHS